MTSLVGMMLYFGFVQVCVFADIKINKDKEVDWYDGNINDAPNSQINKEKLLKIKLLDAESKKTSISEIFGSYLLKQNMEHYVKHHSEQRQKNRVISAFKSNDVAKKHPDTLQNRHSIHKRDFHDHFNHENSYENYPHYRSPLTYERFRPPPDRIHERAPPLFYGGFYLDENQFYSPHHKIPPHKYSLPNVGSELHSRPTRGGPSGRPPYSGGARPPPFDVHWDGARGSLRPPGSLYEGPPPYRGPPIHGGLPHGPPPNRAPQHERPPHGRPLPNEEQLHEKKPYNDLQHGSPPTDEKPAEEMPSNETFTTPINYYNRELQGTTTQSGVQTTSRPTLYLIQAQPVTPEE